MEKKRLFIAINLTAKDKKIFKKIQDQVTTIIPVEYYKKVSSENIHITIKFLGDRNITEIELLKEILYKTCNSERPIILKINCIGIFKHQKIPKVLWAGSSKNQNLNDLYLKIDKELSLNNIITNSDNEFKPHITILRFKKNNFEYNYLENLTNKITVDEELHLKSISLISSELTSSGPIYQDLFKLKFKS